jgi:hypothetical protein
MPYIKLDGTNLIKGKTKDFEKSLSVEFAKVIDVDPESVWIKCNRRGYRNFKLEKEMLLITVYYNEDKEVFDKFTESLEALIQKYDLDIPVDVQIVPSNYYHSYFTKKAKEELGLG